MLFVFIFITIASLILSLSQGRIALHLTDWIHLCSLHANDLNNQILFRIRLPRTFSAFVTGGLLGLAGTLMQALLKNPLADPYILGISSGGALMALLSIILGVSSIYLTIWTWCGCLIMMGIIFYLNKNTFQPERLLLTGVLLGSASAAMISFLLVISDDKTLHSLLFWLLGDLSEATFPVTGCIILMIALIISLFLASSLNLLVRGEKEAKALGLNIAQLHKILFFLSALITAAAVATSGTIGFVGLMIPHLIRLLCGYDHKIVLPGSVLLGGSLLTVADTLSRTLFSPLEIPVGISTALIGIPVLLFLLQKNSYYAQTA